MIDENFNAEQLVRMANDIQAIATANRWVDRHTTEQLQKIGAAVGRGDDGEYRDFEYLQNIQEGDEGNILDAFDRLLGEEGTEELREEYEDDVAVFDDESFAYAFLATVLSALDS